MARIVTKFGGTSVANIERIRNVARHVKREVDAGHDRGRRVRHGRHDQPTRRMDARAVAPARRRANTMRSWPPANR